MRDGGYMPAASAHPHAPLEVKPLFPTAFPQHRTSGHATEVARRIVAGFPQLREVIAAEASSYRAQSLRVGQANEDPVPAQWGVECHAYTGGDWGLSLLALRRMDYRIKRDDVVVVVALENGSGARNHAMVPMANAWNVITVGSVSGAHARGGTMLDGNGRGRPHVVGSNVSTSYNTGLVAGVALAVRGGLLAKGWSHGLAMAVRAVIMASANPRVANGSDRLGSGLDSIYGAGECDIGAAVRIVNENAVRLVSDGGSKTVVRFRIAEGGWVDFRAAASWLRSLSRESFAYVWDGAVPDNTAASMARLMIQRSDGHVMAMAVAEDDNAVLLSVGLGRGEYSLVFEARSEIDMAAVAWMPTVVEIREPEPERAPEHTPIDLSPVKVMLHVDTGADREVSFSWKMDDVPVTEDMPGVLMVDGGTMQFEASDKYGFIDCVATLPDGTVKETRIMILGGVEWRSGTAPLPSYPPPVVELTDLPGVLWSARGEHFRAGEGLAQLHDGDSRTKWLDFARSTWVEVRFQQPVVLYRFEMTSANDAPERDPAEWVLRASNNGVDWVELHRAAGEVWPERFMAREFAIAERKQAYTHFRWSMRSRTTITQLAELRLWGTAEQ